ncbi:zinc finger protein 629-like [Sardina pilchardus]|uniref:zinc finger protein 629-like n=1 Tax=Sardina pilchardus TaxID=27697 RepID=UPI002E129D05
MSTIQSHVALILDDLSKKAVAEIMRLFDNTFAAFLEELSKKQNEIDHLKKKLSPQDDDVDTAGNIVHEKPSVLSYGEFSGDLQTSNEETDLKPKSTSTTVTHWDFPDEQQYDFEGINDDSRTTSPLIEEEMDDTASEYSRDPVEYGNGEMGVLEFELKAAEVDRLTEEAESGMLRHSPTSDIHHNANLSMPIKNKVGRPRKSGTRLLHHSPTSDIHHNANSSMPIKNKGGRPRKSGTRLLHHSPTSDIHHNANLSMPIKNKGGRPRKSGTRLLHHSPTSDIHHNANLSMPIKNKGGRPRKSGTRLLHHSPTSDIHHNANPSMPRKNKVGRPRKWIKTAVAETTETTTAETTETTTAETTETTIAETTETITAETEEVERIPVKDIRRRRKVTATSTMTCQECRQVFYRPKDFIRHRFTHKQKQLLTCEWCGVTFPFQSQMVNHVRIHTGERPFGCNVCDKSFISKAQLRSHMWYHKSKESCSLCGADSLQSLEGYTHRRRSTRPCTKCGNTKSVI